MQKILVTGSNGLLGQKIIYGYKNERGESNNFTNVWLKNNEIFMKPIISEVAYASGHAINGSRYSVIWVRQISIIRDK